MSLNTLTDRHVASRLRAAPAPLQAPSTTGQAAAAPAKNALSSALDALTTFIPTEVITLYVAVLAANTAAPTPVIAPLTVYVIFVCATPVLLLLLFLGKWVQQQSPPAALPPPGQWPWWKMAAAAIAFSVWALAVPGNPLVSGGGATVAGILALAVPMLLTVVTPIIERGH